ncbi:hypothetical protein B296_00027543 [Ensete ventricosum]|uniref:Uncharacterized protein n=1 Tax=Ensete ventricosum TaxID=4639 RepID=A0A426X0D2_ENSVE|nr:hypothetical protein B296_00027543 [Ensete ventricosum]
MRLNHVEPFYAFLLRFRSESPRMEGQPRPGHLQWRQPMAKPPTRAAGYDQDSFRAKRIRPGPLTRAVARGSRPQAWLAPAGVGSTRSGGAHEGTPFWDDASLRAQRPQELPPEGQQRTSAH